VRGRGEGKRGEKTRQFKAGRLVVLFRVDIVLIHQSQS
jgi:hypothetical protein